MGALSQMTKLPMDGELSFCVFVLINRVSLNYISRNLPLWNATDLDVCKQCCKFGLSFPLVTMRAQQRCDSIRRYPVGKYQMPSSLRVRKLF